jgi:hypothetical protein
VQHARDLEVRMALQIGHGQDEAIAPVQLGQGVEHRVALQRRDQSTPAAAVARQPACVGNEKLPGVSVAAAPAAPIDGECMRTPDQPHAKRGSRVVGDL